MDERAQAKAIAEKWLDESYADPDGDQCVLARQFNRSLEEIERLRAALPDAEQALIEVLAAQERGANWYTRGADGLFQIVNRWAHKGLNAIRSVHSAGGKP